uniref:Uncharacterized protein n=1 Tax=viral metagenome TaxID=1070528 RepID=A0A6M3IMX1_9ZZZZ
MTDLFWECEYFFVPMEYYLRLKDIYPQVDVERELNNMYMWLDANPRKRKKNYKRFIVNWLNHARGNPQPIYLTYLTGKRKEAAILLEIKKIEEANPNVASQVNRDIIRNMAVNELKKKGIIE